MNATLNIMRQHGAPPCAVVQEFPGGQHRAGFVTLELVAPDVTVKVFLAADCAAWAHSVAAAINTPTTVEVAA